CRTQPQTVQQPGRSGSLGRSPPGQGCRRGDVLASRLWQHVPHQPSGQPLPMKRRNDGILTKGRVSLLFHLWLPGCRMMDDVPYMMSLGSMPSDRDHLCLTFDQAIIYDALISALAGRLVLENTLGGCLPDRKRAEKDKAWALMDR
ncbi:hypothetical protein HaLaN_28061, partial [Haematococcus lacustris]